MIRVCTLEQRADIRAVGGHALAGRDDNVARLGYALCTLPRLNIQVYASDYDGTPPPHASSSSHSYSPAPHPTRTRPPRIPLGRGREAAACLLHSYRQARVSSSPCT